MRAIRRLKDDIWYELRPAPNGVFYIHWSEHRRSGRKSTGQRGLAEANAYFDAWLDLRGATVAGALTCADLWSAKYDAGDERAGYAWANLQATFGALLPSEVTQDRVNGYLAARKAGRIGKTKARPSTIRFEVACLYASWNLAVKKRLMASTDLPVLDAPPKPSPARQRWLDDDEVNRLMAAARGEGRLSRIERFLWIALDACARRTAIQELRWDNGQIDFAARVIHFNPPGREQTRKKRASVPISDRLYLVLERAFEERTGPWVLDTTTNVNAALARVARRAGVEGVHPHVLRHTAATHMARRGVSLWQISGLLGNTTEQVEKVYAKWQPGFGRDAVELIGGAPRGPRLVGEN
jgi:integrase